MSSESSFSRVLRGYDPQQVDDLVQKLRRELLAAKSLHDSTLREISELTKQIDQLELEASVQTSPTAEGLTTKVQRQLKAADTQAKTIILQAESDALLIRSAAEKTTTQFIEAARAEYEQAQRDAHSAAEDILDTARERSTEIIAEAQLQAQRILAEATSEAQQIQGETATLSAKLRADAHNEANRLVSEAQRQAEEIRLVLLTGPDKPAALNKEILSILRITTQAAATQSQLDADLQARHQESVHNTDKYIAAAEKLLTTTRAAQREMEAAIAEQESTAQESALHIHEEAQRQAQQMIDAASAQARSLISDAEKYVVAILASIYTHVDSMELSRESVAKYFDALRLELSTLNLPEQPKKTQRTTTKELG